MSALIPRSEFPLAMEFPFEALTEYTPNALFYVRNHFAMPDVDVQSWKLKVEIAVGKTLQFDYAELLEMPSKTLDVTLECAGNNRIFLNPPAKGVQWALGGVSTASWTGVPLQHVLELAGIDGRIVDVIFEGSDYGEAPEPPKPPGEIHFSRSLPFEKAMRPNVLLAYEMNGERLSKEHGFPLRLIVPEWFAVASVKWLSRIILSEQKYQGYFQSIDYAFWQRQYDNPVRAPITEVLPKAQISHPQMNEQIIANSDYVIDGATWSGEQPILTVEISTDGGASWSPAELLGDNKPGAWRLWKFNWILPKPGLYSILARATDAAGTTQMMEHDRDRDAYLINYCLPVKVTVVE